MESPEVPMLQNEQAAVKKRSLHVLKALRTLDIDLKEAPVITVLGSGGGLRAHIAFVAVLCALEEENLLDAVTYLAGVSGSTWALSSFYDNDGNTKDTEAGLIDGFCKKDWDLDKSLEKVIQAARLPSYSLTDFWAYLVVSRQTREFHDSCLSNMLKLVEEGTLPYPIFAAIDSDLKTDWEKNKTLKTWFEFTPHHAGYPAFGAYIPIKQFGSRFKKGEVVSSEPERDLSFLKGLWGSAIARTEDIKNYICEWLKNKIGSFKVRHSLDFTAEDQLLCLKDKFSSDTSTEGVAVAEALLELLIAYIEDHSASNIQDKLQALQQKLDAESRDEGCKAELILLAEMAQHWDQLSPEEHDQLMENVIHYFARQEELAPSYIMKLTWNSITDLARFLAKTVKCFKNWEWGTTYNFLYKRDDIRDRHMTERERMHLVDAGLAINSSYPLVLPPVRRAHLILSFDFSAGDPFETIRATADYCNLNNIPFPHVEEADLKKWAAVPSDCYILDGKPGPVVMHFPLFNTKNCGDDIQKWWDKYGTFQLSDSYTEEMVVNLLDKSKQNVKNNKETILSEIRKLTMS